MSSWRLIELAGPTRSTLDTIQAPHCDALAARICWRRSDLLAVAIQRIELEFVQMR
jgi:hypothetical protein